MNRMQQVGGGAVSQAISGALSTIHNQSPWEDWPLLLWPPTLPLTGCGVYHKLLSATAGSSLRMSFCDLQLWPKAGLPLLSHIRCLLPGSVAQPQSTPAGCLLLPPRLQRAVCGRPVSTAPFLPQDALQSLVPIKT